VGKEFTFFKDITGSADGMDEFFLEMLVYLVAQAPDQDVYDIGQRVKLIVQTCSRIMVWSPRVRCF